MKFSVKNTILLGIVFTIIITFNCQGLFAQSDSKCIYDNTPLEIVLKEWGEKNKISFSYDYDLIKGNSISGDFSNLSIESMLIKLLRGTRLEFEQISPKNYILKRRTDNGYDAFKTTICGLILDKNSSALPYTNIVLKGTKIGTTSDLNGNFSLNAPLVKHDTVIFSYLGYKTKYIDIQDLKATPCRKIILNLDVQNMNEIIITDRLFYDVENNTFLSTENVSSTTFEMEDIQQIAGLVQKDVFQIVQLLPGINSTDESSSQIHIRGGNTGQTLILYDNIPMYHNGHFFGKISSINPNAIEKVHISKEGYSSSYGSRVSGVIDIEGKNSIPEYKSVVLEGSLLSGDINFEMPFLKNKMAVFINYRHSFTEYLNSPSYKRNFNQIFQNSIISEDNEYIKNSGIDSITDNTPVTSFYDWNSKILWQPDSQNNVSFSSIMIKDKLDYIYDQKDSYYEESTLNIQNNGVNLNWNHIWSDVFDSDLGLSISKYKNKFSYKDNFHVDSAKTLYKNANFLNDYSFYISNHLKKDNQYFSFGYQFNSITEVAKVFKKDENQTDFSFDDDINGITNTLFTDYRLDLDRIDFNFGLRLNHYNLTNNIYFEPRFIVKVYPIKIFSFKLAGGIYHQTINQIVEFNKLNAEDNLWLLSRSKGSRDLYSAVKNTQYSMGFALKMLSWNIDLTFYDRYYKGITSRTLRFDTKDFPNYSGNMSSSGLELSIQKKNKYFYTFLGYTFNRVKYEFEYPEYPVSPSYNQKHQLDILLGVIFKNFTLSTAIKFGSGLPYTAVDSIGMDLSDPNNPGYWIEYQSFNNKNLIPYYRIDLGLSWKFTFKWLRGKITVSAINIMNRKNYLQRNYTLKFLNDVDTPFIVKTDRIGLPFFPDIGLRMLF